MSTPSGDWSHPTGVTFSRVEEDRWQYLQVEAEWSDDIDERVVQPVSVTIAQALEEHGREGWELVSVLRDARKRTYVLRRLAE